MGKKRQLTELLNLIIGIALLLFAIFLAYQILSAIFGGSWSTENIIISLLIFNVSVTFTIGYNLAAVKSDLRHLSESFRHLASDFKAHVDNHNDLRKAARP